jgi:hypothetical protein
MISLRSISDNALTVTIRPLLGERAKAVMPRSIAVVSRPTGHLSEV